MRPLIEFAQELFIPKPILSLCESRPTSNKIHVLSIIELPNNLILRLVELYFKPHNDLLDLLVEDLRVIHGLNK